MHILSGFKHYNLDWKDAIGPDHSHYKQPQRLPPLSPVKHHYCKCWQRLAYVSYHIVLVNHNSFRTTEPVMIMEMNYVQ